MSTEPGNGIVSPNARLSTIKRFFAKPPESCARLLVYAQGEPPVLLSQHNRAEILPVLASEVDAMLYEHAQQTGDRETTFALMFEDDEKRVIGTRRITVRIQHSPEAVDVAGQVFDPSSSSFAVMLQRHTEAHTRLYLTGHQAQLQHGLERDKLAMERERASFELVRSQLGVVREAMDMLAAIRREADEQRRQQAELLDQIATAHAESSQSGEEGGTLDPQTMKLLTTVLGAVAPLAIQKIMAPAAQPPRKPRSEPQTEPEPT
jgi:hypothetical protein